MTQAKAVNGATPEAQEPAAPPVAEGPRELDLTTEAFDFVEVPIPYGMDEYKCPACGEPIPTRRQVNLSKPARYAHILNDVMKCPFCQFIFSYKTTTVRVLKQ